MVLFAAIVPAMADKTEHNLSFLVNKFTNISTETIYVNYGNSKLKPTL